MNGLQHIYIYTYREKDRDIYIYACLCCASEMGVRKVSVARSFYQNEALGSAKNKTQIDRFTSAALLSLCLGFTGWMKYVQSAIPRKQTEPKNILLCFTKTSIHKYHTTQQVISRGNFVQGKGTEMRGSRSYDGTIRVRTPKEVFRFPVHWYSI